jgi:hypothetical protein
MAEGVVTKHVFELIARQVEDYSLVVWYDPENAYAAEVTSLTVPQAQVACFEGSFFQLRRNIDTLMNDERPPRLVVYVPRDRAETHNALIELEAAGVVMQPGQQPPHRNTRLAIVARNALKSILGEETAAEVEKQVDAGKLSLADVNALAEKGKDISTGVLGLIFGTSNPQEVALSFLDSDRHDAEIEKKSAKKELIGLIGAFFDANINVRTGLPRIRETVARHVLMTDLIKALGKAVPPKLGSIEIASTTSAVEACVELAKNWRLRRDIRLSYAEAASKIEKEIGLAELKFDADRIAEVETFLAIERALIRHVETALLKQPDASLLDLARSRLGRFWSDVKPAVQAQWALVAAAAEVLIAADRLEKMLKNAPSSITDLIDAYATGDEPWCQLDTHHRHMESRWCNFESEPGIDHGSLEKLIIRANQRYAQVGSKLAERFVAAYEKASHPVKGTLHQIDVFEAMVKPSIEDEKTAYVWVDALRFEMGREFCDLLRGDFEIDLKPALAAIPTITEIGMASLLPNAGQGRVVSAGGGKLALDIEGTILKGRKERVTFLKERAGVAVADVKLDDLLPKPGKRVRDAIEEAQLVLVTSQEIDELCEKDNITQARRQMDGVLNDLRRGFRILAEHGIKRIILAADHGHLFAEELSDDMKIDVPGGETVDLHRRVWVGVGGSSESSYLRMPLAALGVNSEYDIATPRTFACFKAKGGARAYFHGGLSPQELIIPAAVMVPHAEALAAAPSGIDWVLTPGTPKLATRFFSVQVTGAAAGLFELEPPTVRVEVRAKGKCVSRPVSASYGFEDATGEASLRRSSDESRSVEPNTVALMVVDEIMQKTVTVHLLDAGSGAELARIDKIEVAISL